MPLAISINKAKFTNTAAARFPPLLAARAPICLRPAVARECISPQVCAPSCSLADCCSVATENRIVLASNQAGELALWPPCPGCTHHAPRITHHASRTMHHAPCTLLHELRTHPPTRHWWHVERLSLLGVRSPTPGRLHPLPLGASTPPPPTRARSPRLARLASADTQTNHG